MQWEKEIKKHFEYIKDNFDSLNSQIREAYLANPDLQGSASVDEEIEEADDNPFFN